MFRFIDCLVVVASIVVIIAVIAVAVVLLFQWTCPDRGVGGELATCGVESCTQVEN